MVRSISRPTQAVIAGVGASGVLAAGAVALVLSAGSPASAAPTASSAYGVSAFGVDNVKAKPYVSSSGGVTTDSGSVSGAAGTFTASGIVVKAGAGMASATVSSLTVGGKNIGRASATCKNGVVSYDSPPVMKTDKLEVIPRSGGGAAVVKIYGAGGTAVETITVAVVKCGTGTPPTGEPTPPPTGKPTGKPTQQPTGEPTPPPTGQPTGKPGHKPTGKPGHVPGQRPGDKPDQPAPKPVIRDGHQPVTG